MAKKAAIWDATVCYIIIDHRLILAICQFIWICTNKLKLKRKGEFWETPCKHVFLCWPPSGVGKTCLECQTEQAADQTKVRQSINKQMNNYTWQILGKSLYVSIFLKEICVLEYNNKNVILNFIKSPNIARV